MICYICKKRIVESKVESWGCDDEHYYHLNCKYEEDAIEEDRPGGEGKSVGQQKNSEIMG